MKRSWNFKALAAAVVAFLVALFFLWPHQMTALIPQESYTVSVTQMAAAYGDLELSDLHYSVEPGSEEDSEFREVLEGYRYYITPLSLLQSVGLFRDTNASTYLSLTGGEEGSLLLGDDGSVVRATSPVRGHVGLGGASQGEELIAQVVSLLEDWGAGE